MNQLHLFLSDDDDWEQFCSPENDSSITTDLEQVEYIRIAARPPRNLLEIALTKLSQTIKFFTHLSCIQLDGGQKDLNHRLLSTVCEALQQSTAQQKIRVGFFFGVTSIDDNVLPVANLMKNCTREIRLCIRDGHINEDETREHFADALRHLSGAVKELTLGGIDVGDDAACALAENLKVNATLDSLSLNNNDIGVKGAKALAGALKQNGTLTELRLTDNSIGDEGAKALAGALRQNGALTELSLSNNSIGDDGAEALADALKYNSSVTGLYLVCNSIGNDGAEALAGALKQNGTLTTLNLTDNYIGDDGAIALGGAIACNVTLEFLDLGYNGRITEEVGVEALFNGMNRNSSLTEFRLSREHAGIEFALRRNKALLKETAWMERFSDQDIVLKNTVLSKAMERYSMSHFMELTFLFLKSQVSMIAETDALTDPAADE